MSFDLLAPHYRWMEALCAGGQLQRCRTALLEVIAAPQRVLIYGEGNGRFLVELCRRFPEAQVTVVEASKVMIELASARLRRAGLEVAKVEFIHADALTWQPPVAAYDLIVTCFFLDCFRGDQLQQLVPTIASAAAADAQWLHADFQIAPAGLRRVCSRVIVGTLYAFFRWATRLPAHELVNVEPCLSAAGFTRYERREFIYKGKPPALLGDSQSLTVPGVPGWLVMCDGSKLHKTKQSNGTTKSKSYEMGM